MRPYYKCSCGASALHCVSPPSVGPPLAGALGVRQGQALPLRLLGRQLVDDNETATGEAAAGEQGRVILARRRPSTGRGASTHTRQGRMVCLFGSQLDD